MVSTDRVPCIYAAERLRSQETLSSDRLQGACADGGGGLRAHHRVRSSQNVESNLEEGVLPWLQLEELLA